MGDLDKIVVTAMHPDPSQRYSSVTAPARRPGALSGRKANSQPDVLLCFIPYRRCSNAIRLLC